MGSLDNEVEECLHLGIAEPCSCLARPSVREVLRRDAVERSIPRYAQKLLMEDLKAYPVETHKSQ